MYRIRKYWYVLFQEHRQLFHYHLKKVIIRFNFAMVFALNVAKRTSIMKPIIDLFYFYIILKTNGVTQ